MLEVKRGEKEILIQVAVPMNDGPAGVIGRIAAKSVEPLIADAGDWSHTADYSVVKWRGQTIALTIKQRLIVQELDRARRQGFRFLDTPTLLEAAESDGGRVRDIFRDSPAWLTVVVPAKDSEARAGCYSLAID